MNTSKLDKFVEDFRTFLEEEFADVEDENPQLGVLGMVAEVRYFPAEGVGDSGFAVYCSDTRSWVKEKVFEEGSRIVSSALYEVNFESEDE